jgi:hypothetical protein
MAGIMPNDLPHSVRIAGRAYVPGADRGVAILYTAAGWVVQRLPGQVLEEQRAELIRTLGQARNLVVEVQCSPVAAVRVRDGQRLLVEIPAAGWRYVRISGSGRRNADGRRTRISGPGNGSGTGCHHRLNVSDRRHCSSSVLAVSSAEWMPSIART